MLSSLNLINEESIHIQLKKYEIILKNIFDFIYIIINSNKKGLYEVTFKEINSNELFGTEKTGNDLIRYIKELFEKNHIQIIEKEQLFIIKTNTNKELKLLKKRLLSEKDIFNELELINKKISIIEKKIKEDYEKKINEMEEKILIKLKDYVNNQIITKKEDYGKKINVMEEKINNLLNEFNLYHEENKEGKKKIDEIEKRMKRIEKGFKYDLKLIKTINAHDNFITCVSVFPSGNIISVSDDKSIKIWDNNFNLLQNIPNAHKERINYIDIKDENNFVTCSNDKSIKTWIKKENTFKINQIKEKAHENIINKVLYYLNEKIISCSDDKSIKIWESQKKFFLIFYSKYINSLLLLKDKNILISGGNDGITFWSIDEYNIKIDYKIKKAYCKIWYPLDRIDENRIIVGSDNILNIISLSEKRIIDSIDNKCKCNGIKVINHKGIFLVSEFSYDIKIYKIGNFKCIKIIKNAHKNNVIGFSILHNNLIASFSFDKKIKIWEISEYDYIKINPFETS